MTEVLIKERPILFSGAMVRALLAGTKTQTRRATGLDFINENPGCWQMQWVPAKDGKHWLFTCGDDRVQVRCPYGVEGERLWVRETLFWSTCDDGWCYQAGNDPVMLEEYTAPILLKEKPAIPSIHMPREASRLLLEVVSVGLQRVQDISEVDARDEGADRGLLLPYGIGDWQLELNQWAAHKTGFQYIWYKINGAESWTNNPWVWVVKFKVIESTNG
jgi:hypothetical protein